MFKFTSERFIDDTNSTSEQNSESLETEEIRARTRSSKKGDITIPIDVRSLEEKNLQDEETQAPLDIGPHQGEFSQEISENEDETDPNVNESNDNDNEQYT